MEIKAPRGTYDILPEDSWRWQWMENILRGNAQIFGYREIRTPVFEHTELFERGVGSSTDIVSKEMYTFKDRSDRSLTLRPEATASCARALIEHRMYNGLLPVKWYYMGPMFRYDRPQSGRYRQFHQFGVEAFGSGSPYLDAEIITLLVECLSKLGLNQYELHLNSLGCSSCRPLYREKLIEYFAPLQERLCPDCQQRYRRNPLRVLDCKNETCRQVITGCPAISEHLCDDCREHYLTVQAALKVNGINYCHDDGLVRGLDYYTRTAFEVHIPGIGAQSAIGGGGRYDGLVEDCGGPALPGIGFALGLERLLLALQNIDDAGDRGRRPDVFVACMSERYEAEAFSVVQRLRQHGVGCEKDYNGRSPKAQMKYANRLGARLVIIIGEDEVASNSFTIRNMRDSQQSLVDSRRLVSEVKQMLRSRD